jgi:GNAT superfamily N-acetyltransferase
VQAILDDPGRGFFTLAGDQGVATTTIRISAGGGASAEIEEIWVQPSARGQGMGGRLLRTAGRRVPAPRHRVDRAARHAGRPGARASPTSTPSRASATVAG